MLVIGKLIFPCSFGDTFSHAGFKCVLKAIRDGQPVVYRHTRLSGARLRMHRNCIRPLVWSIGKSASI